MTARRLKLLAWLLPLFIARSLLPIGFMLSFDASGPRIVFCPSVVSAPAESHGADAHAAHAHHDHASHHAHHHGDDANSSSAEQSHQTCPFAFAAAAPLASVDHFAVTPRPSEVIAGPRDSAILVLATHAHPIRGPPALS